MVKKEVVKVVGTTSIYGPTDFTDELIEKLNGKEIFRSDYLDKITAEASKPSSKLIRKFKKLPAAKQKAARGYDADHPFVTVEENVARAWRYVAIKD